MSSWLIRIKNGSAFVWKRKFFAGMVAIPWCFHGGTRTVMTPDSNDDVLTAAFDYITEQDEYASVTVHFNLGD